MATVEVSYSWIAMIRRLAIQSGFIESVISVPRQLLAGEAAVALRAA
jgi:hypothetical protein